MHEATRAQTRLAARVSACEDRADKPRTVVFTLGGRSSQANAILLLRRRRPARCFVRSSSSPPAVGLTELSLDGDERRELMVGYAVKHAKSKADCGLRNTRDGGGFSGEAAIQTENTWEAPNTEILPATESQLPNRWPVLSTSWFLLSTRNAHLTCLPRARRDAASALISLFHEVHSKLREPKCRKGGGGGGGRRCTA